MRNEVITQIIRCMPDTYLVIIIEKLFEKEVTYEKAKCTPYELNPLMVAFHLRGLQYCHPALWLVRASQSLPFSCKGATDLTGAVCSGHSVSTHCFSCRLCCHYGIDL